MRRLAHRLWEAGGGASAAEFALVLPLLLMFLLGIIDVGRLMWTWNRAEKATQMGVRFAVATDMVPAGLAAYSFTTNNAVPQGDPIPESEFGGASCEWSGGAASCTCSPGATCPTLTPASSTAFGNIVARMRLFLPELTEDRVTVEYAYSGLGYAGDPNGSDVAPLVIVRLRNMAFQPLLFTLFGASITLPDFSAALTLEDGSGTESN